MPELIIYKIENARYCANCGTRIIVEPVLRQGIDTITCPRCNTLAVYYHLSSEEEIEKGLTSLADRLGR